MVKKTNVNATGSGFFTRYLDGDALPTTPSDLSNFRPLTIHTSIIDRLGGTSHCERIWSTEPNLRILQRAAVNPEVREEVKKFFLARRLRKIMNDVIPVSKPKVGEKFFQLDSLFKTIAAAVTHDGSAAVIMECLAPSLFKLGMIGDGRQYTSRIVYPLASVTVKELTFDVMMDEIARVATDVSGRLGMNVGEVYSKETFAATFAEAFVPVGNKILETNELGSIVDDIVRGVRSVIDPELTGLLGEIPTMWKTHPVVSELSSSYPFVAAALAWTPGTSIALKNDLATLQRWAPAVLASLKSSSRYAIVNADSYCSELGKINVENTKGQPVSFVLYRDAKPQAAAQAIYCIQDDFISGAMNISNSKSGIDQVIASAYQQPASLGTSYSARRFADALHHLVEDGFTPPNFGYMFDVGNYAQFSLFELACLLSERVEVNFSMLKPDSGFNSVMGNLATDEGKSKLSGFAEGWIFTIPTSYKDFPWSYTGRFLEHSYVTSDVREALLVHPAFEARVAIAARPQMLANSAFATSLIGFDANDATIDVKGRIGYKAQVGSVELSGKLAFSDIASLVSHDDLRIVKPVFNINVFDSVLDILESFDVIVDDYQKDSNRATSAPVNSEVCRYISRMKAQLIVDMCNAISPALKQQIHRAVHKLTVLRVTPEQARLLGARLTQQHYVAFTDYLALMYFFAVQGIDVSSFEKNLERKDILTEMLAIGARRVEA